MFFVKNKLQTKKALPVNCNLRYFLFPKFHCYIHLTFYFTEIVEEAKIKKSISLAKSGFYSKLISCFNAVLLTPL